MTTITIDQLQKRKAELQAEVQRLLQAADQARANAEMVNGMVQECDYWLAQLGQLGGPSESLAVVGNGSQDNEQGAEHERHTA